MAGSREYSRSQLATVSVYHTDGQDSTDHAMASFGSGKPEEFSNLLEKVQTWHFTRDFEGTWENR